MLKDNARAIYLLCSFLGEAANFLRHPHIPKFVLSIYIYSLYRITRMFSMLSRQLYLELSSIDCDQLWCTVVDYEHLYYIT